MENLTEKLIYDCDNTLGLPFKEVDDGLTLLYLLGIPQIELLGITTTFGNGQIDGVFAQTQKLVDKLGLKLPVLKGEGFHGQSPETPAAKFLVEMVRTHPHDITILGTGPLGNLYAAGQLDPDFYKKVRQVIVMGGYLEPVILGYRDLKELNFSANPTASFHLLRAPCPVKVFPAQICLDAPYHLNDIWRSAFWPLWLKLTLTQWLLAFGLYTGEMVFYLWDLLPAVYLTRPDLFEVGPFQLGSTLNDLQSGKLLRDEIGRGATISIAARIKDRTGFYRHLENAWAHVIQKYANK